MKNLILAVLSLTILSCSTKDSEQPITHESDYVKFLNPEAQHLEVKLARFDEEVKFWNKKAASTQNGYTFYQKLADTKSQQFELTGEVENLYEYESIIQKTLPMLGGKRKANAYILLSSNAIKQHKFKEALEYSFKALDHTSEKYGPMMMMFDAYMELGEYDLAAAILKESQRTNDFHYLVRLSKFQDHSGHLDSAILTMEKAYEQVKNTNSETSLWALTNLGDMYGHAGELEKSYQHYLQVLEMNPDYLHALKGIAWIAYSHDRKTSEARRILQYIDNKTALPDANLLLAEISEYRKDAEKKKSFENKFLVEASKAKYEGMYNKYLIEYHIDKGNYQDALEIAQYEVTKRSTPLTNVLLALAYDKHGDHEKALQIVKNKVEGISFEPETVYYMGMIYQANNRADKAEEYLKEALDASYELGPIATRKIKHELSKI